MDVVPAAGGSAMGAGKGSTPAWAIIARQELRDLWFGGRALAILFGFSLFMSLFTYLLSTSEDLTRMTQTDLIGLLLQVTVIVGILLVLVLSADSFSGERDRSTLESLLLTPVPRRDLAIGKFAGALSLWAGVLLVSLPFVALPTQGTGLLGHAIALGASVGTLLVIAFYFLGTVVSTFSRSNLMSFAVSLFTFFALLSPLQLPGSIRSSAIGTALVKADPASAGIGYMGEVLGGGGSWSAETGLLVAPIVFLVVVVVAGIVVVERYLNLMGGRAP